CSPSWECSCVAWWSRRSSSGPQPRCGEPGRSDDRAGRPADGARDRDRGGPGARARVPIERDRHRGPSGQLACDRAALLEGPLLRGSRAAAVRADPRRRRHHRSLADQHAVFLALAGALVALVFLYTARVVARAQAAGRPPRGFAAAMEAMVLYIRQEVILANVGPHGEGYVNYLLTVFFFILACNLLGLLPWSATPTSNIAVTGAMAGVSLVVIEISGMRALGLKGYLGTIFFLPEGLPTLLKPVMLVIMTPIEIIGKLAKPFALAVRLFANMTAGHVVVLALIGLTFFFQSYLVGVAASVMATGIM